MSSGEASNFIMQSDSMISSFIMQSDSMISSSNKRIAVVGHPVAMPIANGDSVPWTLEKLQAVLDGKQDSDACEAIALYRVEDKSFWAHRIVDAGWPLFLTHPVVASYAKAEEFKSRPGFERMQIGYEYFKTPEWAEDLEKIGPLLFFSVRLCVEDELAISQALLEFFDVMRTSLPTPIDEVFARTRNMKGNTADPDLMIAHMRMKNGSEGHLEAHCLTGGEPQLSVQFYGRNGQFLWDGLAANEKMSNTPFSQTVKSYQVIDWFSRSGRFDRVVDYREAMK